MRERRGEPRGRREEPVGQKPGIFLSPKVHPTAQITALSSTQFTYPRRLCGRLAFHPAMLKGTVLVGHVI